MSNKRIFAEEEYYHIYNRGTNKMQIFNDEKDYFRFQKLLYLANSKENIKFSDICPARALALTKEDTLVDIISYCLMPNHFHILIKIKNEKDASKFILKLLTGYSMYFNKKYERTGTLFEGRTKSKHIESDKQLKYLFSYIHLNPSKIIDKDWRNKKIKNEIKILNFLKNYKFSSFMDYLGINRLENKILNINVFPKYFKNPKEYLEEINEWLNYNKS